MRNPHRRLIGATLALVLTAVAFAAGPAQALTEQQELIDKAALTVKKLRGDPEFPDLTTALDKAKAVLVFPDVLKAGAIIGGEGGDGILVVRGEDGSWSYPAFFSMGGGSLGLQLGVQTSELLLVVRTAGALDAVLNHQVKLGGDLSIAAGATGTSTGAATTTALGADIYSYARTGGVFVGATVEGAVLSKRDDWNYDYYGPGATARSIALERKFMNPGADGLRASLATR
jgi:lipid-binding SYLF domain-containing protein